jgi:hypothetical protein
MSDLISRNALLDDIRNTITESSNMLDWINLINKQNTAYDVDEVVEQLQEASSGIGVTASFSTTIVFLSKAIEIVKGGGMDE